MRFELSGVFLIDGSTVSPSLSLYPRKLSIVLTTLKDSHRLPLRAAKSAS
jgi:hypothetical protein